jgi:hypothetical protein
MSIVAAIDASSTKQTDEQPITNVQISDDGTTASDTSIISIADMLKGDDRLSVEFHLYH